MNANSETHKKALLYAEGSKRIGMGHIRRMMLLQDMLRSRYGFHTRFITCRNHSADEFLKSYGGHVLHIGDLTEKKQKINGICDQISLWRPNVFILDVLDENLYYCFNLARREKCLSVAIVDYSKPVSISADLVVNGNPALNSMSRLPGKTSYLLGTNYFIMDPAYAEVKTPRPSGSVNTVLLTLGGSDHNDLIFKIINALEKVNNELEIVVISSNATGYIERLSQFLKSSKLRTKLYVDVPGLERFWEQVDVAVTAGGNTLFERIASRLPGATVCQLGRQMKIADCFHRLDVNFNLGYGPNLSENDLVEKLVQFLGDSEMHNCQYCKSPEVVDGRGIIRIGDRINKMTG